MRRQFKDTVMTLGASDDSIVIILGDVSVYLFKDFQNNFPERFYNLGICENTMISTAAGLSAIGFNPFVHTIAPFITERSYEQIKLDMCYNQFGGNIVSCGASFDYAWDGATHHSYTDLAILRMLPNMEVIQPGSRKELDVLLRSQYNNGNSTYYRLSDNPHDIDLPVTFGKAVVIRNTESKFTLMTAGPILGNVSKACHDLDINIVYFHTLKPIDRETIEKFRDTKILVVHDAYGLYEAICEVPKLSISTHIIPDKFFCCYGTLQEIRRSVGLDTVTIRKVVSNFIQSK